jgi:8-oxo-dGTP diphosphatase
MYFEQLKTYGDPGRDPREFTPKGTRVISVVYFALVSYDKILEQKIEADDDVDDAKWFSLKSLPKKLAFDHDKILKDLLNRIIGKISYTPIAFELLPKQFTWNELQNIYTVILNKIDTAHNFRRKISSMFEIKKLETKKKAYGRPSFLLEYVSQKSF